MFEVTANSSGVYGCNMESLYPPPFYTECHITKVIMGGNQILPVTNQSISVTNQTSLLSSPLIPELVLWAGCGVLLVYSLSITCFAACLWTKLKKAEEDSSMYVNTRTWETKSPCKA
ncbi:hypothetical protein LDENG_00129700 [Lucifuga dentata]|nr:hypothetical protein LDENG_00129700 [Lucifuga dentata]